MQLFFAHSHTSVLTDHSDFEGDYGTATRAGGGGALVQTTVLGKAGFLQSKGCGVRWKLSVRAGPYDSAVVRHTRGGGSKPGKVIFSKQDEEITKGGGGEKDF